MKRNQFLKSVFTGLAGFGAFTGFAQLLISESGGLVRKTKQLNNKIKGGKEKEEEKKGGADRKQKWPEKKGALPQRELGTKKSGALPQREMGKDKRGAATTRNGQYTLGIQIATIIFY